MKDDLFSIVMKTSCDGDGAIPYVVLQVHAPSFQERVKWVERIMSKKGIDLPASLSFWFDSTVWGEWLHDLPKKFLNKSETSNLEKTGFVFTTKVLDDEDPSLNIARVEVSMSVFWDLSFGVECIGKYDDLHYEGHSTLFYEHVLKYIKENCS